MAVEQVEHHVVDLTGIPHIQRAHPLGELLRIERLFCKKVEQRLGHGIIHDPVVLVSAKIGTRIMPIFPDDDDIPIVCLDRLAEIMPKIVGDLVGHIQPPAVDAVFSDPIQRHIDEVRLGLCVGKIELRHISAGGKTFVVALFRVHFLSTDDEPIEIRRVLPVAEHVLKIREAFAAMVEHGIHHDADPQRVRLFDEPAQFFLRAELRIYLIIVVNIVLVVGDGAKYGRQIERRDAQPFEIAKLLADARKVSPRKALRMREIAPFQIDIGILFLGVAAEKPIDEDLIEHRALHPFHFGHDIRSVDIRQLKGVVVGKLEVITFAHPVLRNIIYLLPFVQFKDVDEPYVFERKADEIVIECPVRKLLLHHRTLSFQVIIVFISVNDIDFGKHVLARRPQAQLYPIARQSIAVLTVGNV